MTVDPVTLTRTAPDAYRWPNDRPAVFQVGEWWIARRDVDPRESGLVLDSDGSCLFTSPTLAASALGARLPVE